MVRGGERGTPSVRLVQDFGGPDDPDPVTPAAALPAPPGAAALAPKRGRGRPPGSRNKTRAEALGVD